jgi:DNA repair exonuclease SbcCD nuclease subunit
MTHGALAIESKHQPNDFPIALHAASRAGLDYLAVGHWHNWLANSDGGRLVMPGTPEPDRFANDDSGHVALVNIDAPGQTPRVEKIPVATLTWRNLDFDLLHPEASRASLSHTLAELTPHATHTVLRITLTGTASPSTLAEIRAWLAPALAPFLVGQLRDETRLTLTAPELADLQARHPILAQVLADIDRLETFAIGSSPTPWATSEELNPNLDSLHPLTLAEAQALLAPARINLADLTTDFFNQLRQTIFLHLQEVTS